ncbi:aldo/keto reductase [[Kitasatospora] papulosa]|uniref:aldo/keto reductase n=1 Tax=[Kitasatospora] papulosa TaxID=1464011 RepID=UPI0036875355
MTAPDLKPRHIAPGLTVNPLGVGCWAIGGPTVNAGQPVGWGSVDDTQSLEGLRAAVEHGANFFDTADVFGHGHSERLLGQLLKEVDRESVRIASKIGWVRGTAPHPYAGPKLRHQFEQSMENLGVEYLDAYFLHTLDFGDDDDYLHVAINQMHALRDAEYIKAIGMRGPHPLASDRRDAADVRSARFAKIFRLLRPDVLWTRCNPLSPPALVDGEDLFSFTARHGVSLMLTEPLAQGLLTGKYHPDVPAVFGPGDHRRHKRWFSNPGLEIIDRGLETLRERFGRDPQALVRVALRYSLQQADHTAVIVGFTTPAQIRENYSCLGEPLTQDELAFVDATYARIRNELHASGDSYRRVEVAV